MVSLMVDIIAFGRGWAMLVARDEATRDTNGAPTEALQSRQAETGVRFVKRWSTALDERVRDEHEAMEGETVLIDQPFSNGLQFPSEPNCFVPGTLVQGSYVAGLRAKYSGEVLVIQT